MKTKLHITCLALALLTGCQTASLHDATRTRSQGLTPPDEFIQFGSTEFHCAFFDKNEEGWIKEYIPTGQTLQNWEELISVRNFNTIVSPKKYIQSMAAQYRYEYPGIDFAVFERPEFGQWGLDFIAFARGDKKTVEWNCFLAEKSKAGSGITVYQYAMREFSFSAFEATFREERPKLLSTFLESDFTAQEVSKK